MNNTKATQIIMIHFVWCLVRKTEAWFILPANVKRMLTSQIRTYNLQQKFETNNLQQFNSALLTCKRRVVTSNSRQINFAFVLAGSMNRALFIHILYRIPKKPQKAGHFRFKTQTNTGNERAKRTNLTCHMFIGSFTTMTSKCPSVSIKNNVRERKTALDQCQPRWKISSFL